MWCLTCVHFLCDYNKTPDYNPISATSALPRRALHPRVHGVDAWGSSRTAAQTRAEWKGWPQLVRVRMRWLSANVANQVLAGIFARVHPW